MSTQGRADRRAGVEKLRVGLNDGGRPPVEWARRETTAMKTVKILLQALVTVAALALPAAASAQAFPFPTSYGPYGTMFAPFAGSGLFGDAFDGTALDPNATTVHVVPPTGGTVM